MKVLRFLGIQPKDRPKSKRLGNSSRDYLSQILNLTKNHTLTVFRKKFQSLSDNFLEKFLVIFRSNLQIICRDCDFDQMISCFSFIYLLQGSGIRSLVVAYYNSNHHHVNFLINTKPDDPFLE